MCLCKLLSLVQLCKLVSCSLPCSFVHGILQPRILDWVAIPFSREPSQPTDQTQVSCIAGRFLTICDITEAPYINALPRETSQ